MGLKSLCIFAKLGKPTITKQNRLVEQRGSYLVMIVCVQFFISPFINGIPNFYVFRRNVPTTILLLIPLELGRLITNIVSNYRRMLHRSSSSFSSFSIRNPRTARPSILTDHGEHATTFNRAFAKHANRYQISHLQGIFRQDTRRAFAVSWMLRH